MVTYLETKVMQAIEYLWNFIESLIGDDDDDHWNGGFRVAVQ
jgi:hypothetical protein